jgi:hypothetical protein
MAKKRITIHHSNLRELIEVLSIECGNNQAAFVRDNEGNPFKAVIIHRDGSIELDNGVRD